MPTIVVLCAGVLAAFGASLIVPALAALGQGDWRALEAFLVLATSYGFTALGLLLSMRPRVRTLNRAGLFASAICMWLTLVVAAFPPFVLIERQGLAQALFEATSAAVTLGITLIPQDAISGGMAFYRGTTAWMGGLLTLLLAVYILGPFRVGGTPNRHLRLIQHSQQDKGPALLRTARDVAIPYAALTAACALALVLARVPAPDALVVAMSTLATNGFVPSPTETSVLANAAAESVMMVFMVVGATSILWHRMILERRWYLASEQSEGYRFLLALLVMIAIVAVASVFMPDPLHNPLERAFNFIFDIVSVMTTTGVTHDPRLGVGLPFELVLLIALVGGCAYSTAGGIKFFRFTGMLHHSGNELRRLVHPHAALRDSVDFDPDERERARAIWSAFFLAVLVLTISILALALLGLDLPQALGLATGAFSQIGNIAAAGMPEGAGGQSTPALLLLTALIGVLGRIEILVVLAAVSFNRW